MERITEDLILEILSRLPVKSIVRARCVSKSWNRLVAEDHRQRKRLPPAMAGLIYEHRSINGFTFFRTRENSCYDGESPIDEPDFSSVPRCRGLTVVHICNGLVLCRYMRSPYAFVCNPATRAWKNLHLLDKVKDFNLLAIGFDLRTSPHHRVLGCYPEGNSNYKFMIFESKTGDWSVCPGNYEFDPVQSVFQNGIFYITQPIFDEGGKYILQRVDIIAIGIDENVCRRIELPHHVPDTWSQYLLGTSDGLLHLAVQSGDEMLVWALIDIDSGQWVLKHASSFGAIRKKIEDAGVLQFSSISVKTLRIPSGHGYDIFFICLEVCLLTILRRVLWKCFLAFWRVLLSTASSPSRRATPHMTYEHLAVLFLGF